MSNKRRQIEGDERTDLQKYTEGVYKSLKKEKNVQVKQAVEDDCDRGRSRTAELKDTGVDVTISIIGKSIAVDRAILAASSEMSNKRKQIEGDDQADSLKYTEREYKSLKKENAQLKQAVDDDCVSTDRGQDRTAELKDTDVDVTISIAGKDIAVDKAILAASSEMSNKRKKIEDDDQADSRKYTEREYKALKKEKNVQVKQAVDKDCDRGRDRTGELKDAEVDVTISIARKNIAVNRNILVIERKKAEHLLAIADKYKLEKLKSTAEDFLCSQLSGESVVSLHTLAEATNAYKLKDECLKLLNSFASAPSTSRLFPPIARVHDPCLIALFKQLPPADQMTARTVCCRWADLVTYAARSTRSLAILVGDQTMTKFNDSLNYYSLGKIKLVSLLQREDGSPMFIQSGFSQWNSLLYRRGLDEATVEAIGATFVNLKTLQVSLIEAPSTQLDFISHLLELLAHHHQLITLKLYEAPYPLKNHSPDRLFAAINGLTTLKNLHIDSESLPYRDLPIIAQLEQLLIYWAGCSPQQFTALLRQHATDNTSLCSVKYICNDHNSDIEHFTSLSDHLLSRFTHFGFPRSRFTNSQLISTHFRHLTNLYIYPTDLTIRRLFDHLSQLTQLLYLHLEINFSLLLPDDQPHLLLSQLKSVKALELRLTILSHFNLEQLKIGWTMPNLQAIDLWNIWLSKCTDCTIEEFRPGNIEANLATFKHCYRQMLAPLKANCTKLRTILYDRERFFGSAEELLAE